MTKTEKTEKAIEVLGYEVGCIDTMIEQLTYKELDKVLCEIKYASTDVDVLIKKKLHVAEITNVDNEIDINILTEHEYRSRYGNDRWEDN